MLQLTEKLQILSNAAKYDASCASSGGNRKNNNKGLGNSQGMGICHSYTEDGRCVSLLKILLTNVCIFDCAYCINRRSSDTKRAAFTVEEVVKLTINFYRRNYIEGLFLSSGIFKNADYTMERLVRVCKLLRTEHNFNGYIHLKAIPGASKEIIYEAGLYADRLSVNIELPSEKSLKALAPEKNYAEILQPMSYISKNIADNAEERKKHNVPIFASGGQSTQLIVGASPETDLTILQLADNLYKTQSMKRVYYSAYIPIHAESDASTTISQCLTRENRIYQADWLIRMYGFQASELLNEQKKQLDTDIDPKLAYALNHLSSFPLDINKSDYHMILRIPGIGLKSADKIIKARRYGRLNFDQLKKIGINIATAQFFITCSGKSLYKKDLCPDIIKAFILGGNKKVQRKSQLSLF